MTEQLTDEERARLINGTYGNALVAKALRIIEAREKQAKELASALEESIQKKDEELEVIRLAQAVIGAHNERCAKHAAARAAQEARIAEVEGWYTRAMKDIQALNQSHAAVRAALVAQLEAAVDGMNVEQSRRETEQRMRESAEAQVAELTRERDEAQLQLKDARRWFRINGKKFIASPVAADELEEIIRGK